MPRQWTWYYPKGPDEVVALLAEHGERARLVAGSTSLCLSPPTKNDLAMIDLSHSALNTISRDGDKVRVGAMVTAEQLQRSEDIRAVAGGMVCTAASRIGPMPVRNRVTVGGNVVRAYPWCDLPVALLALGAELELVSAEGTRSVSAQDLLAGQPRSFLKRGELMAAALLPLGPKNSSGVFSKFAATEIDHAIVSVAVRLRMDGATCKEVGIAVGAVGPLPQRLAAAEQQLVGSELSETTIDKALSSVSLLKMRTDRRGDVAFRQDVTQVLIRRGLLQAQRDIAGGGASC